VISIETSATFAIKPVIREHVIIESAELVRQMCTVDISYWTKLDS